MAEQFPLSAIREIKFLNSLKHKNIVNLREIVSSKGCESMGKRNSIFILPRWFKYPFHRYPLAEADLPTMDLKRPGCQEEGGGHPHAGAPKHVCLFVVAPMVSYPVVASLTMSRSY